MYFKWHMHWYDTGADPGFQVRWGALKKIAPSGGRRENFWGISCEKWRFYAKKHIFPILGGAREIFGVFHVKNHDFTPKNIFCPILGGGGRAPGAPPPPPPWIRPCDSNLWTYHKEITNYDWKMYIKEKIRLKKIAKMTVTENWDDRVIAPPNYDQFRSS